MRKKSRTRGVAGSRVNAWAIVVAAAALYIIVFLLQSRYLELRYPTLRYITPPFPEMVFSLAFFLAVSYLTGYTLTKDVFKPPACLELVFMRIGFGLAALPVVFILLETAGVPLAWHTILLLAIARPAYDAVTGSAYIKPDLKVRLGRLKAYKPDGYAALALLVSALAFTLALYGSYAYPYLEDGDSWEHAVGVKYVSLFKTYTKPQGLHVAHYLKPYPPSYDVLLGLTHQLNSSISWTLKFFNSLIVSLTYVFAFYFVKMMTGDGKTAFYSTLVLAILPPFGSHSIWAHTMSAALLFPVFYAVDRVRQGRGWLILSAVFLAGSLLVQPLMSFVMGVFYVFYVASRVFVDKREGRDLAVVCVLGLALSMVYWLAVAVDPDSKGDLGDVTQDIRGGNLRIGVKEGEATPTALQVFFPATHGDIYMQQGFGVFVVLLAALSVDFAARGGVGYLKKNPWFITCSLWLGFSLIFLFSAGFSFALWPTRFWGVGAIPLCVLAGVMLANIGELKWIPKKATPHVTYLIILGLFATSGIQKVQTQIKPWPTDLQLKVGRDFAAYVELFKVPPNMPVYPFCMQDKYVMGVDKMSYPWDKAIVASREKPVDVNPEALYELLKGRRYRLAVFDYHCVTRCMDELGWGKGECELALGRTLMQLNESVYFNMEWRSPSTTIFSLS
jgi:hypothetical protein